MFGWLRGHIHGGYGIYPLEFQDANDQPTDKKCLVCNASILNEKYKLANMPLVFTATVIDGKVTIAHEPNEPDSWRLY